MDYQQFRRDMSLIIYKAIPHGKDVSCRGPATKSIDYHLSFRIHEAIGQIMSDVLTKGKASWCLCINPTSDAETPFSFKPKKYPIKGFKTVPMVIRSRDIGIPRRKVRSLTRRLKRSDLPLSDISLMRFNDYREIIADRWGHVLSWQMSDPSVFTDACILLEHCDSKILAIKLCEVIQDAMNETLIKSGLAEYRIDIPTFSRKELESAKQLYIEGNLDEEVFSNLVFSRA